jgi:biotin operon repressor
MATNRKYRGIESLYEVEDEKRAQSTAAQASPATLARLASQSAPALEAGPASATLQAVPEVGHDSQASPATQTEHEVPNVNLLDSLPMVGGYLKLTNQIVDKLLPQLEPYEQILYLQLYRLSHGNGKAFCLISMPKLAQRTKVSERSLWRAVAELKRKGLITRGESVHGKGKEQGITFWVASPAGHDREASPAGLAGHDEQADNKRKELKESNKREPAAPDYKSCPDCQGSGFFYPDGFEGGVVKCKHKRLTQGK